MKIKDLKYLLRDYEEIVVVNADTKKVKSINDYKQDGRKLNVAKVMYNLGQAVVICRN